jgi:hypothetical protein
MDKNENIIQSIKEKNKKSKLTGKIEEYKSFIPAYFDELSSDNTYNVSCL